MTIPAIAPPLSDDDFGAALSLDLAGPVVAAGFFDVVVFTEDDSGCVEDGGGGNDEIFVVEAETASSTPNLLGKVIGLVTQQSFVFPQHHLSDVAVPSHGVS